MSYVFAQNKSNKVCWTKNVRQFVGFIRVQKPVRPAENKHSPARRPSKKKKKTSCTSDIFNANVK